MPIFEYRCNACGTQFEKIQRAAADIPPCPRCGSIDVRKEMSTFAAGSGTSGSDTACFSGG